MQTIFLAFGPVIFVLRLVTFSFRHHVFVFRSYILFSLYANIFTIFIFILDFCPLWQGIVARCNIE